MSHIGELGQLTKSECLLIHRRRLGKSQAEMAEKYGVSRSTYSFWERVGNKDTPKIKIHSLAAHECCLLYRRRSKYTQTRVASEVGISRFWLHRMEMGYEPCDELICYWEA